LPTAIAANTRQRIQPRHRFVLIPERHQLGPGFLRWRLALAGKLEPRHAVIMEGIALAGFAFSLFSWGLGGALVTPGAGCNGRGVAMPGRQPWCDDLLPEGLRDQHPLTISIRCR